MADFLRQRLDFLQRTQNEDGGWGYFPGKRSWLEAYRLRDAGATGARRGGGGPGVEAGRELAVARWKLAARRGRGGTGTWVTALGVHLCCVRGQFRRPVSSAGCGGCWDAGPGRRVAGAADFGDSAGWRR